MNKKTASGISSEAMDCPYPLKRKILYYGGTGAFVFICMLLVFLVKTESDNQTKVYVRYAKSRALSLYSTLFRDSLNDGELGLEQLRLAARNKDRKLHKNLEALISRELDVPEIKLFDENGLILYHHLNLESVGELYDDVGEAYFQGALKGVITYKFKEDPNYGLLLEVYYPLKNEAGKVQGIFELYEDASDFNKQVNTSILNILLWPTLLFAILIFFVGSVISTADKTIKSQTKKLVDIREHLKKYLSSEAAKAVMGYEEMGSSPFDGERKQASFFFSDIRGFTSFSEGVPPEVVVQMLNRVLGEQAQIIEAHGGYIDKFVGDEVMAIFPDAENALLVAKKIMAKVERLFEGHKNLGLGIGLHSGVAVFGSIGAESRRDYTPIGGAVNMAARLCSVAKASEILMSADFYHELAPEQKSQDFIEKSLSLKGLPEGQKTYSLLA